MHIIRTRNVHQALPLGLHHLASVGIPMPSRAGDVLVAPGPVTTVYDRPAERVMFWADRDANPFLHFFEALHMLAGRNDVAFLARFTQRMKDYSDDGVTLHGAYGNRLRSHFSLAGSESEGAAGNCDQLDIAVYMMRRDPFTRRIVLSMWDAEQDLDRNGKDLPCNTQIYLSTSYGKRDRPNQLNMTVCCRSNDIIWGAYGTNAVQFSTLLEYLAGRIGLDVGVYHQMSNNYHAYQDVYDKTRRGPLTYHDPLSCPYTTGEVTPYPMIADPTSWDRDLKLFLESPKAYGYLNPYFAQVAKPLWFAHAAFKKKDMAGALEIVEQCQATDWRKAAREWLLRRQKS